MPLHSELVSIFRRKVKRTDRPIFKNLEAELTTGAQEPFEREQHGFVREARQI